MNRKHAISARDIATELLESYITENDLEPGDRLPSERELCAMWNLNRTTLRSAIQRLVDSNVLYSRMGSGTFVARPKFVRNLQDVHGFSEDVRLAGRVPGSRLVYAVLREADKFIVRNLRVPLGTEVFDLKRVRLIDDIPCSIETTIVNTKNCRGLERHDYEHESLFDVLREEFGITMMSGDERISVTALDVSEAELLGMEEGHPAIYKSGLMFDTDNQPIICYRTTALSEHVRYATEMFAR